MWQFRLFGESPQTVTLSTAHPVAAGLNLPDRPAGLLFYQWLPTKYVAEPQFVANTLFTRKAVPKGVLLCTFITAMYGRVKTPTPPSLQDINIDFPSMSEWHLRRSALWPSFSRNKLTCSVPSVLFNYLPYLRYSMCVFINGRTSGSCTVAGAPNPLFRAASRHCVDSRQAWRPHRLTCTII